MYLHGWHLWNGVYAYFNMSIKTVSNFITDILKLFHEHKIAS
jgi:hypothetical protein